MNLRLFSVLIFISLFICSFSCSNNAGRSRKPAVNITIESVHQKIIFADDINVSISVKLKDGDLLETKIFVDSTLVQTSKNTEFKFTLKKYKNLGKHTIKAVSVKTDGIEGVYYKVFEVFSDIIPTQNGFEVVKIYPHSETAFTEGLEIKNGVLYESTGENKTSGIFKIDFKSGKILQSTKLADQYFGEGITIFNNQIFQLTYKTKIGFIYDLEKLALIDSFHFESTEGWGMTHDDKSLIMSDGTHKLTYINPVTLKSEKRIQVYDNQEAVIYLNELEYSDGYIFANLYTTNLIVKIEAQTGRVVSKIDLSGILNMINSDKQVDLLNGIAIDPATKKMYVTGKYYPKLFEIKLIKKE
jgi:glutaminyl-peptide cyclotransferase